jgi:hypothetical protein
MNNPSVTAQYTTTETHQLFRHQATAQTIYLPREDFDYRFLSERVTDRDMEAGGWVAIDSSDYVGTPLQATD